jgi:cation:H+ antiporter
MLIRDGSLLVFTGLLLLIFFADLTLTLVEGILLLATLIIYIINLVRHKEKPDEEIPPGEFKWYDTVKLIAGVGIIIISADKLVDSSSALARLFGISEWMIGITIVAAGTSVPELATSLVAVARGHHGISIGNLIGSDLFNMLGVLGVASIIRPLTIVETDYLSIVFLAITLIIIFIMIRTGWKITRLEGIILIVIALARWWIVAYL